MAARKPYALGPDGWEGPCLPQSNLPSFMGAPWIPCRTQTLRDMGSKAAFLGVPAVAGGDAGERAGCVRERMRREASRR